MSIAFDQFENKHQLIQGGKWKDTTGSFINAHGAGILFYNNIYYLFGEIKKGKTSLVPGQSWEAYRVPAGGISCYSSTDLKSWKNEGVALAPNEADSSNDLHISKVIERPKVIYNKKTNKFVMWMHIDKADYSLSHAGVAISDKPTGPFNYIKSIRPNGNMSRDITVFKDDDEAAYLIYSSEDNNTMHVCKLTDDYLSPTQMETRIFINGRREAPAIFKHGSTYYLITSGCTGWSPNEAMYATASHPLKSWTVQGNPCQGFGSANTFDAQSTFVLPLNNKHGYLFMADRWNKLDLQNSRYVWLPLTIEHGKVKISWSDKVML